MSTLGPNAQVELAACLQCTAQITFSRTGDPRIDQYGFESYRFFCEQCGATLVGIVAPEDEALLLSLERLSLHSGHKKEPRFRFHCVNLGLFATERPIIGSIGAFGEHIGRRAPARLVLKMEDPDGRLGIVRFEPAF